MVSWKPAATVVLAFASLPFVQGRSISCRLLGKCGRDFVESETLIPIKEVVYVKTSGATGDLSRRPGRHYVRFYQCGEYRGKSLALDTEPYAWVDLPFRAANATDESQPCQRHVMCKITRKRRLFSDKTAFTADVDLNDVPDAKDHQVTVALRKNGTSTGAFLHVQFYKTEFVEVSKPNGDITRGRSDFFWSFFMNTFRLRVASFSTTIEDVKRPVKAADLKLPTVKILDNKVEFPQDDEFFPVKWWQRLIIRVMTVFPFTDRNNSVDDRKRLRNKIRSKKLMDNVVEPPEGRWDAPLSDASMSRVFFSNFGMFLIESIGGNRTDYDKFGTDVSYLADLSLFNDLKYRQDLQNLGCRVFFNSQANIVAIEDFDETVHYPGDAAWGWAKQKARSSAFAFVSISEHLFLYHLFYGNIIGLSMRKYLPEDHEIRLALTPHIFRTHLTCANSEYTLVSPKGAIARGLPFLNEGGYEIFVKRSQERVRFMFYPDELEQRGLLNNPFHIGATDGLALREVLMSYISNLFDEIYPTMDYFQEDTDMKNMYDEVSERMNLADHLKEFSLDNLKLVFGEIIFRVTGMHQAVGNAAVYALEPFMLNFRMQAGNKTQVLGNWETMNVVAVISGSTMPNTYPKLSDNWSHLLHWRRSRAYAQMQSDLGVLGKEIDARNMERRFKSNDFHPDVTAISVLS